MASAPSPPSSRGGEAVEGRFRPFSALGTARLPAKVKESTLNLIG